MDDFGIEFGRLLASFFEHFRKKGVSKKSLKFHVDFYIFLSIFASKLAVNRPTIAEKVGSWRLPGHLGGTTLTLSSSWLRFGTVFGRFWEGLGLIFHTFLSIFLSFLLDFWVSFPIVLRYTFALILVPCSFNAEANNE